jgi:FkbM family methyltransferase
MKEKLEYFLRLFCPGPLYNYSTKIRIPQKKIDFRKFLVAKFLLTDGSSVIDGGAHIGYYTRYFSEIIGEKGKVYSFEPNPYLFRLLNKYARFHSNIVCYQKALSHVTSKTAFYVEPFSLSQDSSLYKGSDDQKSISIDAIALDDFIAETEQIRLIKLDIEGFEQQAIQGAQQLIARCRPWIIFEYVQTPIRNDRGILSLLAKWNYSCINLETLQPVSEQEQVELTDMLAIPENQQPNKLIESLAMFS